MVAKGLERACMFSAWKKRWAETRADVAGKEVDDLLARVTGAHAGDRDLVFRAFDEALRGLQDTQGDPANWSDDTRREVARVMMQTARRMVTDRRNSIEGEMDRVSSYGAALLSLYCECQTLPGATAKEAVRRIEEWHASTRG